MATQDPFERAAKREQIEEIRREAEREKLKKRYGVSSGTRDAGQALAVFFMPYVVWALFRASNHTWGKPVGKAITHFFFGTGFWFAAATVGILVFSWIWMIGRAGLDSDD
jgi:hypothetical protein